LYDSTENLKKTTQGVLGNERMMGLQYPVRLSQVRKSIKSSIIGPFSFQCPFFKILKKTQQKSGYPGSVRGLKTGLELKNF
jgi:hypothetical protein